MGIIKKCYCCNLNKPQLKIKYIYEDDANDGFYHCPRFFVLSTFCPSSCNIELKIS
jgi:hypothetical protein